MTNNVKLPFAEWLYRMAEAKLEPAGRTLAIYAACFDVTKNDELCALTGISPRTLDYWKKQLLERGWVIIPPNRGGRGKGVQVFPALDGAPISFDEFDRVNPRKYCPVSDIETPAEIAPLKRVKPRKVCTPLEAETPAKFAPLSDETPATTAPVSDETPAEFAGESKVFRAPARAVENYNIYNNYNNLPNIYNIPNKVPDTPREYEELTQALIGACNGALDNPANCQGLLNLGIPIMWIESGCDVQRDILPTLIAFGQSHHGKRIKSWAYFTGAITKARDARLQGLPPPEPSRRGGRHQAPAETNIARRARYLGLTKGEQP